MFASGPGDLGSFPGHIMPKTFKMVLNTLQYKVRIEGKVEQSWERSNALPYTSVRFRFLCLMAYQLFLGYLMPKPFS